MCALQLKGPITNMFMYSLRVRHRTIFSMLNEVVWSANSILQNSELLVALATDGFFV